MIARLKDAANRLKSAAAETCDALLCHRAIHGALACLYGAGSAGASKEAVGYAIAGCYAVMVMRE